VSQITSLTCFLYPSTTSGFSLQLWSLVSKIVLLGINLAHDSRQSIQLGGALLDRLRLDHD
jgi:hypothetical protein